MKRRWAVAKPAHTGTHLASAIDDRFIEIERQHGLKGSQLAYESHAAAIDTIEQISRLEKIACQFARVEAFLSSMPSDPPDLLDQELKAAKRAGFADVEKLSRGGLHHGPRLRFGNQAKFQPLLYFIGLARAITRMGGRIHTGKRVKDVQRRRTRKSKLPDLRRLKEASK